MGHRRTHGLPPRGSQRPSSTTSDSPRCTNTTCTSRPERGRSESSVCGQPWARRDGPVPAQTLSFAGVTANPGCRLTTPGVEPKRHRPCHQEPHSQCGRRRSDRLCSMDRGELFGLAGQQSTSRRERCASIRHSSRSTAGVQGERSPGWSHLQLGTASAVASAISGLPPPRSHVPEDVMPVDALKAALMKKLRRSASGVRRSSVPAAAHHVEPSG